MNTEELPMILFTILAQMSVGAFWVLGIIQVYGAVTKIPAATVDRVTHACLFAAGPLLVLGFLAASFHLNDPFNAFNTLRHVGSSWLSREISFGILYGALGFLTTLAMWWNWFSRTLRQVLAVLTALAGLGLVVSMTGVYYFVRSIPAWHTPATWILFFASTVLTGSLAVGVALLFVWTRQTRHDADTSSSGSVTRLFTRIRLIRDEPLTDETDRLTTGALQGISLASALAGIVLLVTYPLYLLSLSNAGDPASSHVASHLAGSPLLPWRLVILAAVVLLTGVFAFVKARAAAKPSNALVWMIGIAFLLAVCTELPGRALHYEGLYHVGLNTTQSELSQSAG